MERIRNKCKNKFGLSGFLQGLIYYVYRVYGFHYHITPDYIRGTLC